MADSKMFWNARGFNDLGGYTPTPHFLTKDLMMVGTGIPPLFWKFTSIAWRSFNEMEKDPQTAKFVCTKRFSFTAEQLADEYNIYKAITNWCSAAYSVSAICSREKGRRYNFKQPGEPTTLHYQPNATKTDWLAFIAALKVQCHDDHKKHHGGCDEAFCVSLAWKVQAQRVELKLQPSVRISKWLAEMKEKGVIFQGDDGVNRVHRQPAKKVPGELVSS